MREKDAARYLMMARRYVRQNIISIVGGLLLVTLTVVASVSVYIVMQRQAENLLRQSLAASLQSRVGLFKGQINQSLINTRIIATRPAVITALHRLDRAPHAVSSQVFLQGVAQSFLVYGFTAVSFRTLQGAEVARAGRFLQTPKLQVPLKTTKPVALLWKEQFFLRMWAPVVDRQGRRVGSIRVESPLPLLTRALFHLRPLGRTADLAICAPMGRKAMQCVVSTSGRIGMHSGHVLARLARTLQGHALPMSYALAGHTGVIFARNYLRKDVVAAYAPVGQLGLGMVLMV
ncbi:MAG: putative bifunctional diguanylate cyclase/phosphodiesterase, partial [Thermoplasmataceae archaeon]